jgi:SAM-dependent methyltransferase
VDSQRNRKGWIQAEPGFLIPVEALPYIRKQRFGKSISDEELTPAYIQHTNQVLEMLIPFLPYTCTSILDIGCGIGGIDLLLYQFYTNELWEPDLYLLDSYEESEHVSYGYHNRFSVYNDLMITKKFLMGNGILEHRIHLIAANDDYMINSSDQVEMVISLGSWGYHYPLQLYLNEVLRLLVPGGVVITTLRGNTNGAQTLENHFCDVRIIKSHLKEGGKQGTTCMFARKAE